MEKSKRKLTKRGKRKYTLHDFLPKEVIDDFIEYQNDPEYKKDVEEADEELNEILEYFEYRLGREMSKYDHDTAIDLIRKYSPKDKEGHVFAFLPAETVWEVYLYERGEKWDLWEEFLK
jgi:hypothetical protein